MFKPEDKVICIKCYSFDNTKINQTYTIKETYISYTGHKCLYLKETDNTYFENQFELDIKDQRKQKLNQLCSNQEIN